MILKYLSLRFSEDCYSKKSPLLIILYVELSNNKYFFNVQQALTFVPTLEVMDDKYLSNNSRAPCTII